MPSADEEYCADRVRRYDPDRYLLAMLAPESARSGLLALYAFNTEIAGIRESVSEAMLGEIRLQWWRDAIGGLYAGDRLEHAVVRQLGETIERYGLSREYFDRLINGRSYDLDDQPPSTLQGLEEYARETSAPLVLLALEVLDTPTAALLSAGSHAGTAWALSGLIRTIPHAFRVGWRYLPAELCARHGFALRDLTEKESRGPLRAVVRDLSGQVDRAIEAARELRHDVPRAALPAMMPVAYSAYCQRQLQKAGFDPYDMRVVSAPPMVTWRLFLRLRLRRY